MPIIEGSTTPKSLTVEYDFAKDGGTIGTKTLRGVNGEGNLIPAGSIVTGGQVKATTATGGAGTVALQLEGTADLFAALALTSGVHDVIPDGTGDSYVTTTVARSVKAVVAGAALTAGKFRVTLFYV